MSRTLIFLSLCLISFFNSSYSEYFSATDHTNLPTNENNEKTAEAFIIEQKKYIERLSQDIDIANSNGFSSFNLYNERGVAYFFIGDFESALQDFNYVLTELRNRRILERELSRDRVNIIEDKLRRLANRIPSEHIRDSVLYLITCEAARSRECCARGQHWTTCLGPIANAWKNLEDTWDEIVDLFNKGINLRSFLFGPN